MVQHIYRPHAAAAYLGISRATLYRLAGDGNLPPPIKISERASGWLKTDLDTYLDARPRLSQQRKEAST